MDKNVKVYHQFDPPPITEEINSGEEITEQAGYIPPNQRIEEMIIAGQRLDGVRRDQFDFAADEEVPDDFDDPTRSPGFDLADASHLNDLAIGNLKRSAKKAEMEQKAEEKKEAPNGPS